MYTISQGIKTNKPSLLGIIFLCNYDLNINKFQFNASTKLTYSETTYLEHF